MFQILIKIIIERNDIKLTTMRNNDKEKIQIKFYLQENERIKNLVESIKKEKQNYKNLINRRNSEIKDLTNYKLNLVKQLHDNESEFKGLKGEVLH